MWTLLAFFLLVYSVGHLVFLWSSDEPSVTTVSLSSTAQGRTSPTQMQSRAPGPDTEHEWYGLTFRGFHNDYCASTTRSLDEAMRMLPEALREAFVLHACENLAYEEIGQILNISAGTARVRAHRARLLLRDRMGPVVDTWYRERGAQARGS